MIKTVGLIVGLVAASAGMAAAYSLIVGPNQFRRVHWSEDSLPIPFVLNDQTGPGLANITDDSDPVGAVNRALAKWPSVSAVRATLGSTAVADAVADGINVITFADTPTNRAIFEMAGGPVGLTLAYFDTETLLTTEADVFLNPAFMFTTALDSDEMLFAAHLFDVEAVVSHELGHSIGLHHSGVEAASMWALATVGARILDPDDIAGARTLYPVGPPNRSIRGTVRVNGAPAFGAQVVAVAASGPVVSALTLPDGTYRIEGLEAGEYGVYVEPLDGPHAAVPTGPCVQYSNLSGAGIYNGATLTTNFPTTFFHSNDDPVLVTPAAGDDAPVVDFDLASGVNTVNPTLIGPATVDGDQVSFHFSGVAVDVEPGTERWLVVIGPNLDQIDSAQAVGDDMLVDPENLFPLDPITACPEGPLGIVLLRVVVAPTAARGGHTLLFFADGGISALTGALRVLGETPTPLPSPTPSATPTTTPSAPPTLTPTVSPTKTHTPTRTPTRTRGPTNTPLGPQPCVGDCNHNRTVDTAELVLGVRILLGQVGLDTCSDLDDDGSGEAVISELVQAIAAAQFGCISSVSQ